MSHKKNGRYGKYGESKIKEKLKISKLAQVQNGRSIINKEHNIKIAPGHPNQGRR